MKYKVTQTFYIPHANKLYQLGEVIDVDPSFATQYSSCLSVIEKTAPAPVNKMVTTEKETTKTKTVKKGKK